MARLNLIIESDDDDDEELPDISKLLLAACNPTIGKKGEEEERVLVVGSPASQTENASNRRQRPLQVATGNELLMPVAREGTKGNGLRRNGSWDREQGEKDGVLKRLSPRKAAQIVQSRSKSGVPMDEESSSEEHMSDFVVDDSESGAERSPRRRRRKEKMVEGFVRESESGKMVMSSDHSVIDLLSPRVDKRSETPESGSSHEAFDEDCLGRLRLCVYLPIWKPVYALANLPSVHLHDQGHPTEDKMRARKNYSPHHPTAPRSQNSNLLPSVSNGSLPPPTDRASTPSGAKKSSTTGTTSTPPPANPNPLGNCSRSMKMETMKHTSRHLPPPRGEEARLRRRGDGETKRPWSGRRHSTSEKSSLRLISCENWISRWPTDG